MANGNSIVRKSRKKDRNYSDLEKTELLKGVKDNFDILENGMAKNCSFFQSITYNSLAKFFLFRLIDPKIHQLQAAIWKDIVEKMRKKLE